MQQSNKSSTACHEVAMQLPSRHTQEGESHNFFYKQAACMTSIKLPTPPTCVSPRVNSALPCVRGSTPARDVMGRMSVTLRPSARTPSFSTSRRITPLSTDFQAWASCTQIQQQQQGQQAAAVAAATVTTGDLCQT
jgi:hypothetical protein